MLTRQPWQMEPSPAMWSAVERGLAFLDEHLPNPLLAPPPEKKPDLTVTGPMRPEAGKSAKEIRDAEMRARADEGATVVELATEFRVSIRTVYNVVNSEAA